MNTKGQKIQYKSLVFVTPTPGGTLVKALTAREEELNKNNPERIKFVKKGGKKVSVSAKNPFKKKKCVKKTFPLCAKQEFIEIDSEKITVPCNAHNVGYRWLCIMCKEKNILKVYEGETGRSARTRGAEHLGEFEKEKASSVLFKHKLNDHKHEKVKFKTEITQKFTDGLTRQANKAMRITYRSAHELLNSKAEFNHPPLARVIVERKKRVARPPSASDHAKV